MPERNCSSEREIWPSWLLEGRLRERARWRSSSESLMWSARRKSCGGLVAMMAVVGEGAGSGRRCDDGTGMRCAGNGRCRYAKEGANEFDNYATMYKANRHMKVAGS
jgi:hypothetical protein